IVSSVRIAEAGFDHATLFPESYVFVGVPTLLERLPLRSPADAAAHRLLDVSPDLPLFRYLLEAGADSRDWPFARAWYLGTIAAIRGMVLRGAGVAWKRTSKQVGCCSSFPSGPCARMPSA
ncbi:MAG TPA: LysR substrate-binding domain-containing protein, partial [Myxococcota bacterium]|nr:LysR substrate-binding domain-containing protein [Myxococcota bacterium]